MGAERFPDDFLFGAATSAYQLEGGIENDWSAWERAGKLKDPQARCGPAVDHWNRFEEDVGLLKSLGLGGFRLSLEWARLEPERGKFDDAAAKKYRRHLEALRAAGITPVVTLHHFTHPSWFHAHTPWHSAEVLSAWERWVKFCAELLDGLDPVICTLNEPMVLLAAAYLGKAFPPGIGDPRLAVPAMENMARAHVIARAVFKSKNPRTAVGLAQHLMLFAAARSWHPLDQAATRMADLHFNHALLVALHEGELRLQVPGIATLRRPIEGGRGSMDYLGINYYTRGHMRFRATPPFLEYVFKDPHGRGLTDIGWEIFPEGFGTLLRQCKRYGLPIWVLENGIDDRSGQRRAQYMHQHLAEILKARDEGIDVRAYFHWSLVDNFEWLEAFGPRFGLFQVDRATMERSPTPACEYYKRIATSRMLTSP
jgi:beta-glucosidase